MQNHDEVAKLCIKMISKLCIRVQDDLFHTFHHCYRQGTIYCGILVAGVGERGDPRKKWEEKCCFCLQTDLKEHRNARSVYIAFQKAWFTAFIAIIKKVEHTL